MAGKRRRNLIISLILSLSIGIGEALTAGAAVYAGERNGTTAVEESGETAEDTEASETTENAGAAGWIGITEEAEPSETTEDTEDAGNTETAEGTEHTEDTEDAEASETTEHTEDTEDTENMAPSEMTEDMEDAGNTETAGETENTKDTEDTENMDASEMTEDTEDAEDTERAEDEELSAVSEIRGAGQASAGTIPLNGSYRYTAASTDAAYFKIEVKQKGYFSVSASANAEKCGSYMVVSEDLTPLTESRPVAYNGTAESGRIGAEPGTYYVVYTKTGRAEVAVEFRCKYTAADDWESEDNDSFRTADEISVNKFYNGNTLTGTAGNLGGQEDYFKFTVKKNGAVKINFLHEIYKENSQYYTVSLYNANYDVITGFFVTGGATASNSAQIGITAGTYYVCVHGMGPAWKENTEYRFQAEYTQSGYFERENNENVTTATEIAPNKTYRGSLKSIEDVDYYKVTLAKAGCVRLKFGHAQLAKVDENYYHVYLYGADGTTVYSEFDSRGNSVEYSDTKIGLAAGDYYIKVVFKGNYDNGTYTLRASYQESSSWRSETHV